ncbi:PilN domain-containing protein [Sporosarcina sp. NPDC096371]|uniref:PilN domain-containing protein n=1 Tax=Sporosarcina sp. NPDC096371 TaxID=3364530 RepID=UPI00381B58F5
MVPEINLLPQMERKSAGNRWVALLLGIAFILIVLFLAFQYFSLTKSVNALQVDQQALLADRTSIEANITALEQPEQMDLTTVVEVLESGTYPVSPLIEELNRYRGNHVYLREFILIDSEIEFVLDFETMPETATYVGELTGSAYFTDVKVEEITTVDLALEEEERTTESFDVMERFTNRFTVTFDPSYLRSGGAVR